MRGHDSSIHNISVHASGRYALTSSNSVAQLWDLDTFSRKRMLNGAQTVGIQQVWIYLNSYIYEWLLGKEVFDFQCDNIFTCSYLVAHPLRKLQWKPWDSQVTIFLTNILLVQSDQHFILFLISIKTVLKLIVDRNKEDHWLGDVILKDNQILKIKMDASQVHKLNWFRDKIWK